MWGGLTACTLRITWKLGFGKLMTAFACGCPLCDDLTDESFAENTISEYLDEEELLLRRLGMEHCRCFGLHPSNVFRVDAMLPGDKAELLHETSNLRGQLINEQLVSRPKRYREGGILL